MLELKLQIDNPLYKEDFKLLWCCYFETWLEHRNIELQTHYYSKDLLSFKLTTKFTGYDHAGPSLEIAIMGFGMIISMPDERHWNTETASWEVVKQRVLLEE